MSTLVWSWSFFFVIFPFLFPLIFSLFSFSTTLFPSCFGLDVGWSTSLPLLKVITALTYLTFEDSSSWASTSWIPLGFWWGWEGKFHFSCTMLRLVSLKIVYWTLSIFWDRSFCIPSILLFNVLSTLSILQFSWALMDFWFPTKSPTTLLRFTIACSRFEACWGAWAGCVYWGGFGSCNLNCRCYHMKHCY